MPNNDEFWPGPKRIYNNYFTHLILPYPVVQKMVLLGAINWIDSYI